MVAASWAMGAVAPACLVCSVQVGHVRVGRRVLIFGVFLIAGAANPSPDPVTMLILGGACAVLVEVAEFIVWANDRRRTRLHPDPYAGLADDELSPLPSGGREEG